MEPQKTDIDTNKLAELFGVKIQTVRLWRCKGTGPPYLRIGAPVHGRIVYDLAAVQAWLAGREYRSTSEESAEHAMKTRANAGSVNTTRTGSGSP